MNEEILIELGEVSEKTMGNLGCYSEVQTFPVTRQEIGEEDPC